ncbi:Homeodomain protein [Pseudocohnilembus persalinus]|uniref:Homeodomain protein n=1 Tax=Pseudocohnilembus persalinus TaxID=266149 RepID=A0A0V0QZ50_PSEPJ|nr:Homeodomain protein [Pseudocohnilembus persalinus]|eukprot:KRX07538.1 Homeodomain protein [Pseudocohnilembus persalinus]
MELRKQIKGKQNQLVMQEGSIDLEQQKKLAEISAYKENVQQLIQENKNYEEKLRITLKKIEAQMEKINGQKCMAIDFFSNDQQNNNQNLRNSQQQFLHNNNNVRNNQSHYRYQSIKEEDEQEQEDDLEDQQLQFRNNDNVFQLFDNKNKGEKFTFEQMQRNQKKHVIENISFYKYESKFQSTPTAQVLEMAKNPKQKSRLIEIYKGIQNAQNFQDESYQNNGKINDYIYDEYNNNQEGYEQQYINGCDLEENFIKNCLLSNRDWLRNMEDQKQLNHIFMKNSQNQLKNSQNIKKEDMRSQKSMQYNKGILDDTFSILKDGQYLYKQYLETNNLRPRQLDWKKEDDDKLIELVQIYGEKHWGQISNHFDGRFFSDVSQRWLKYLNKNLKKGRWNLRDDLKLAILVELYSDNQNNIQWSKIIKFFDNRTDVQVRERWCNLLDPNLKILVWTKQEDQKLIELTEEFDGKWSKIAKQLDSKTDNQCLRKWKYLVSKKFNRQQLSSLDISYYLQNKKPVFQCIKIGRLRDFVEKDLLKKQSVKFGDIQEKLEYTEQDTCIQQGQKLQKLQIKDNSKQENNNQNQSEQNTEKKKRGRKPKAQQQAENLKNQKEVKQIQQHIQTKKRGRKKQIKQEEQDENKCQDLKLDNINYSQEEQKETDFQQKNQKELNQKRKNDNDSDENNKSNEIKIEGKNKCKKIKKN